MADHDKTFTQTASLVDHSRIVIDMRQGAVIVGDNAEELIYPMASAEAFAIVANAWVRVGWDAKYVYGFTWLGRPVIQLPEDLLTMQEVVYSVRPDVIIETGIAHGGSLVFYASLCRLLGNGRVIGVDAEIRQHNRAALEAHPLFPFMTLIEGDSVGQTTIQQVNTLVKPGETVMVILDSGHGRAHVLAELRAYGSLVTPGSYIVAMDGIMARLAGAPRSGADWSTDNPMSAASQFLEENSDFEAQTPQLLFNEGFASYRPTYCPGGFLRRVR